MQSNQKTEITSLSSKGQIVLPKNLRKSMYLETGAKFLVVSDGANILLKPIKKPNISEFENLIQLSNKWAKKIGLKESDIDTAIKEVRNNTLN